MLFQWFPFEHVLSGFSRPVLHVARLGYFQGPWSPFESGLSLNIANDLVPVTSLSQSCPTSEKGTDQRKNYPPPHPTSFCLGNPDTRALRGGCGGIGSPHWGNQSRAWGSGWFLGGRGSGPSRRAVGLARRT